MITIRPATASDADALPAIERASGALFRGWPGLEWIADDGVQSAEKHRELIAQGIALVAVEDGRPVAFLNAELTDDDALHIWQIAVELLHQRQGIGRRLIEAACVIAETLGAQALTLTTFRDVPWNEPYYRRLGFGLIAADDLSPRLRSILDREALAGLPPERRCAMKLPLKAAP